MNECASFESKLTHNKVFDYGGSEVIFDFLLKIIDTVKIMSVGVLVIAPAIKAVALLSSPSYT